ncbi:MAG: hypothetical protein V7641_1816 [Blastocatellia bacterium]
MPYTDVKPDLNNKIYKLVANYNAIHHLEMIIIGEYSKTVLQRCGSNPYVICWDWSSFLSEMKINCRIMRGCVIIYNVQLHTA